MDKLSIEWWFDFKRNDFHSLPVMIFTKKVSAWNQAYVTKISVWRYNNLTLSWISFLVNENWQMNQKTKGQLKLYF